MMSAHRHRRRAFPYQPLSRNPQCTGRRLLRPSR
ncbi:hypothetical protein STIAU_1252, partial [Stigmatella aurantiaca DW4/3-1]